MTISLSIARRRRVAEWFDKIANYKLAFITRENYIAFILVINLHFKFTPKLKFLPSRRDLHISIV